MFYSKQCFCFILYNDFRSIFLVFSCEQYCFLLMLSHFRVFALVCWPCSWWHHLGEMSYLHNLFLLLFFFTSAVQSVRTCTRLFLHSFWAFYSLPGTAGNVIKVLWTQNICDEHFLKAWDMLSRDVKHWCHGIHLELWWTVSFMSVLWMRFCSRHHL